MEILFFTALFLVFYHFAGYGLVLYALVKIRRSLGRNLHQLTKVYEPEVTLVVPAYNERSYLPIKLENSLGQNYPPELLTVLFVTEGSTDDSTDYLLSRKIEFGDRLSVLGGTERLGKMEAVNRAMKLVHTPIVVFTDANTQLNKDAIRNLVQHFANDRVGAVAGEKRISTEENEATAGAGEGLYWKIESQLKRLESEFYTVVGAAGELFAIRTPLYQPVEPDTLLDDLVISLRLAAQGHIIRYEPEAYALERPSFSASEEQKRKVRIAHGAFQAIGRLSELLNPFRYGWLTFEYVSHRILRWAVVPFCLILLVIVNFFLALRAVQSPSLSWVDWGWLGVFVAQCVFYLAAYQGYRLEKQQRKNKLFMVPFYFTFMNACIVLGFLRFLRGRPVSGRWERVRRADQGPEEVSRAA